VAVDDEGPHKRTQELVQEVPQLLGDAARQALDADVVDEANEAAHDDGA
jgi:hypothetical protein